MQVYWSFLAMALIGIIICNYHPRYVEVNGKYEARVKIQYALMLFGVVIFFCGLRSGIADTPVYISGFQNAPSNILSLNLDEVTRDKGYAVLEVLFKQFISKDFHAWLLVLATISGISIMYILYRYSIDFGMSFFLFIASTQFTWLVNGMRQFVAVCLIFSAFTFLLDRKWWKYFLVVLLASTIHGTAIIMIPIYFVAQWRSFSLKMIMASVVVAIAGINIGRFEFLFENTQYDGYLDNVLTSTGTNDIRFLVAMVPVLIAFLGRKIIISENNKVINICVNMACINAAVQFAAIFVGAIYIGRIAAYFNVYNMITLPWLINKCFTKNSVTLMKMTCIGMYCIYFYYQMVITWNMNYYSDILGLSL